MVDERGVWGLSVASGRGSRPAVARRSRSVPVVRWRNIRHGNRRRAAVIITTSIVRVFLVPSWASPIVIAVIATPTVVVAIVSATSVIIPVVSSAAIIVTVTSVVSVAIMAVGGTAGRGRPVLPFTHVPAGRRGMGPLRLAIIDTDSTAHYNQVLAGFNGSGCVLDRLKRNKAKAPAGLCVSVIDERAARDRSMSHKDILKVRFLRVRMQPKHTNYVRWLGGNLAATILSAWLGFIGRTGAALVTTGVFVDR
jgi:hypothetical protein